MYRVLKSTAWLIIYIVLPINSIEIGLFGSKLRYAGRVEIKAKESWKLLSFARWNLQIGRLVCRRLGYTGAEAVMDGKAFGTAKSSISISCNGKESTLNECYMPHRSHYVSMVNITSGSAVLCTPNTGFTYAEIFITCLGGSVILVATFTTIVTCRTMNTSSRHRKHRDDKTSSNVDSSQQKGLENATFIKNCEKETQSPLSLELSSLNCALEELQQEPSIKKVFASVSVQTERIDAYEHEYDTLNIVTISREITSSNESLQYEDIDSVADHSGASGGCKQSNRLSSIDGYQNINPDLANALVADQTMLSPENLSGEQPEYLQILPDLIKKHEHEYKVTASIPEPETSTLSHYNHVLPRMLSGLKAEMDSVENPSEERINPDLWNVLERHEIEDAPDHLEMVSPEKLDGEQPEYLQILPDEKKHEQEYIVPLNGPVPETSTLSYYNPALPCLPSAFKAKIESVDHPSEERNFEKGRDYNDGDKPASVWVDINKVPITVPSSSLLSIDQRLEPNDLDVYDALEYSNYNIPNEYENKKVGPHKSGLPNCIDVQQKIETFQKLTLSTDTSTNQSTEKYMGLPDRPAKTLKSSTKSSEQIVNSQNLEPNNFTLEDTEDDYEDIEDNIVLHDMMRPKSKIYETVIDLVKSSRLRSPQH